MKKSDITKILITEEEIASCVKELGQSITEDYEGKNLHLIGVLKGSAVFMTDLMRKIDLPLTIDFLAVSSYGTGAKTTGVVRLSKDLDNSIEGKDVLIVEDILDSGLTLTYITEILKQKNANSVKVCTLLNKPERRDPSVTLVADYEGFKIPDEFVVGYGLDYAEKYRNLPYVGILGRHVYE